MGEETINRQFKDRLFKLVFGTKKDLLNLYNAINGTDYRNADDIEINTIQECIYMTMRNDVSFLLYDVMNLFEHQSTRNPNMPLRGLFYLTQLYKTSFEKHKDLYSTKQIPIPTPQFVVFYNGDDEEPDERYMKLSDSYIAPISGPPALECQARLLNINVGHNAELMEKCKRLRDYSTLVKYVKDNLKSGMDKEKAVNEAIDRCLREKVLFDILSKHRKEATDMLLTEYDEIAHINNEKDISHEEGGLERQTLMLEIMERLNAGEGIDSLLSCGLDRETLEKMASLMNGTRKE